jgi:uncharacterized protein (TIGR02145 family)
MYRKLIILSILQISMLFSQTQIAVVDFEGLGVSSDEARALTNRLMIEMHRTQKFRVLEREMLDKIIEEQKFQLSGCNSDKCLVELGQIANVHQIVGGSVSKVGYIFTITARLISVQSGEVVKSALFDYAGDIGELMRFGMANIAAQLASIPIPKMTKAEKLAKSVYPTLKAENIYTFDGSVSDIDGNVYKIIQIGKQVWMAENLKVTHYQNGDKIETGKDDGLELRKFDVGAYDYPGGDKNNISTYGLLYNWHSVSDLRMVAPKGWHIPNDDEWKDLESFLGIDADDIRDDMIAGEEFRGIDEGEKLKVGVAWVGRRGTNQYGFTALPAGFLSQWGDYEGVGMDALFWSSTVTNSGRYVTASYRRLKSNKKTIGQGVMSAESGMSIRCIKD